MQVPHSTARRWLSFGTLRRERFTRTDQPKKVTDTDVDNIIDCIKDHFKERIRPIKELIKDEGINASPKTVQRALKKQGYRKRTAYRNPNIRPTQAAKRLQLYEHYLTMLDD